MTHETNEPRARRPEEDEPGEAGGAAVLGLLAPPQIREEFVEELAAELPGALSERVGDRVSWEIPTVRDSRVPDVEGGGETIEDVSEWRRQEGWDLAVCLTDLPLLGGGRAVVADASPTKDAALVSLPALGATRRRRRAREAIVRLVEEVLGESLGLGRGDEGRRDGGGRLAGLVSPIGRVAPGDDDGHPQLVAPAGLGRLRLLAGMVRANRPFRVFLDLSYALAVAFATGAYALVTPSIWQLGDAFGWARLLALMVVSVAAIVVWLIVVHGLWERPSGREGREQALLFNATTVITLTVGALALYALLFALIFLVAGIFVPGGFLRSTLGHPVGLGDYASLTWMTSSLATVAGALGSGLESSVDVRDALYSYHRERRADEGEEGSG